MTEEVFRHLEVIRVSHPRQVACHHEQGSFARLDQPGVERVEVLEPSGVVTENPVEAREVCKNKCFRAGYRGIPGDGVEPSDVQIRYLENGEQTLCRSGRPQQDISRRIADRKGARPCHSPPQSYGKVPIASSIKY